MEIKTDTPSANTIQRTGQVLRTERLLWILTIFLTIIGIASVIRRTLALTGFIPSPDNPRIRGMDSGFAKHPVLTLTHIFSGAVFLIAGIIRFRKRTTSYRRVDRIFLISGYTIGISALIMSYTVTIGGANETAATTVFAILFLLSLTRTAIYMLRKNAALQREWQIRAFAIAIAIASIRMIVGMFFALTALAPREFFGIAFWLGFTAHLIAAEAWITYTRKPSSTPR